MPPSFLPSRRSVIALTLGAGASTVAALLHLAPVETLTAVTASLAAAWLLYSAIDLWLSSRAWRRSPLEWRRGLPAALALGVRRPITGVLVNRGPARWRLTLFDGLDETLAFEGLPLALQSQGASELEVQYLLQPGRRGKVRFLPAELRVRSRGGSLELRRRIGIEETLQVYPNFAAVARYAWLAGDRRLSEIGIKSVPQRGAGTDFKQLSDYRPGDAIRDIDWKATLRHTRPIVRQYQDERDQRVLFLLDCGRRMRADEGAASRATHFDEALNALMLLAYVALKDGDEVGAMTFGNAAGESRRFAPRKGVQAMNALMGALYDIEPQATHSDYLQAAAEVMRASPKRSLVVVLTNFRDEDAPEIGPALKLLRTKHLVLLASLRERALREIAEQPLVRERQALEVAGAHLFAQARDDAFRRLAARDALLVDVEPAQLAAELVNRYHAVKRAGLL
jgi:uncharacterized protein (DUF58 family)